MTTDQILDKLSGQFMQPEIWKGNAYEVSVNHGETHIVPADVCSGPDFSDYVDGTVDLDDDEQPIVTFCCGVWLARLSAPGYMDCTDWTLHATEDAAREYIANTYGDDLDDDNEWSGALCPIAPDACWIDDVTGEHVNASTGERTAQHPVK